MDETEFVKNLEGVGMNGLLIVFLFGIYKFLSSRNFISKCGWVTLDFRSKELREREVELKHIERMAEIELQKMKIHTDLDSRLKYGDNIIDDNYNEDKVNTGKETTG